MSVLLVLVLLQLAASIAGFVFMWRRFEAMGAEMARLRQALEAAAEQQLAPRLRQAKGARAVVEVRPVAPASVRAANAWRSVDGQTRKPAPVVSAETRRVAALAVAAFAPALSFLMGAGAAFVAALGLCVAGAMMLVGVRPKWGAGASAGVAAAIAWALAGFAFALDEPTLYCAGLVAAAICGLAHAHHVRTSHGPLLALAMSAAAIALGAQTGMVGSAGAAYAIIVAATAIAGATSLRLEWLMFAAFAAALLGLFVFSGQADAAIWFTPATSGAGALFFAIAAVRAPQLGGRGAGVAGIGALAPLLAVAALHNSGHGLADPREAAAAYTILAALLTAILGLAASRREHGHKALRLTLWTLAAGALAALASAIPLVAAPPMAAAGFAALGLGLAALDSRAPHSAWRVFACVCAALAMLNGCGAARMLFEPTRWSPWGLIGLGMAAPALLLAAAAAQVREHEAATSVLKLFALGLGVAGASFVVRVLNADGAPSLTPMGFAEAGAHVSTWLALALALGWNARRVSVRAAGAAALGYAAVAASVALAFAWLIPLWRGREPAAVAGFELLAATVLFWAHWAFWRGRGARLSARASLATASFLSATLATLAAVRLDTAWLGAAISVLAFASAIAVNFAPGVIKKPSFLRRGPNKRAALTRPSRRTPPRASSRDRLHERCGSDC